MIANMINQAAAGLPLWLPDLRERFAKQPGADRLIIRLCDGRETARDWELSLPFAQNGEEQAFILRFVTSQIYNLLSAYSACEVILYCEEREAKLYSDLPALFDRPDGLGKVRNIARRICGGFSIRFAPISSYSLAVTVSPAEAPDLGEKLRSLCRAAEGKGCVGIDIGGSDIKLAVSSGKELLHVEEYDWNPAASRTADEILDPILQLIKKAKTLLERSGASLDAVGISFPDIVINDRIVGGETPKTKGMRDNPAIDYEREFARLRELKAEVLPLCASNGFVRLTNDGNMAAFTAAVELAAGAMDAQIDGGVIAHSLGTDLGTGWLEADGSIPAIPLEMYDLLLDLGDLPSAALPPEDLRSSRNENSAMNGVRRYLGQAAAYRLAWNLDPSLLDGFVERKGELLVVPTSPEDLRKPCLEQLMRFAASGNGAAEEIFRQIGRNLSVVAREMNWIFRKTPPLRFLFGRFVKSRRCFELLCEGFDEAGTGIRLEIADEELANTALMRALSDMPGVTLAQFAQAIGSIYFSFS